VNLSPIDSIAAVGDVADPATWSGIPWHFLSAAKQAGWRTEPWRLNWAALGWNRRWWNLGQALRGHGMGGYQYSPAFLDRAEAMIPASRWRGWILSFNQHFPRARSVTERGGRPVHYLDATFASFCEADGLAAHLPRTIQSEACRVERENLQASEQVVTMARWAADSVAEHCGVPRSRVATILPGANIDLPAGYDFPVTEGRPGRDRPLMLGFVGKDWRRKGLPFLLEVSDELGRRGVRAEVRCAGHAPPDLARRPGVSFAGFIDKSLQPGEFLRFLAGCDVGCLFSTHEPLGISTLEFLRAGVPVAGFAVEGLQDTLPPDAGWRFDPTTSAGEVADALQQTYADAAQVEQLRSGARAWSAEVTWERCLGEWEELLGTGIIQQPAQPWLGLNHLKSGSSRVCS
jgi:glycosyltransferase involved in cell wall biosynthesis